MRSTFRLAVSVIALASMVVALTACSHDLVTSGTNSLDVTITPNPPLTPGPSGPGRYERASFFISKIQALPTDPAVAALYGDERLSFLFETSDATEVNLVLTQEVVFAEIALTAGTYKVTALEISPLVLVDTNLSPTPESPCIERLAVIDHSQPAGIPTRFNFNDPPNLVFTVQPGQTKLAFTINVPGLIAGYESAYTCQPDCGGGRPCLTAFSSQTFRNVVVDPANITIR